MFDPSNSEQTRKDVLQHVKGYVITIACMNSFTYLMTGVSPEETSDAIASALQAAADEFKAQKETHVQGLKEHGPKGQGA